MTPAVQVLHVMCAVAEYDELPVRHNEDKINLTLAQEVRWPTPTKSSDDPHTKANLLLQVSLSHTLNACSFSCMQLLINLNSLIHDLYMNNAIITVLADDSMHHPA